jgi:hypothetical protein
MKEGDEWKAAFRTNRGLFLEGFASKAEWPVVNFVISKGEYQYYNLSHPIKEGL